MPEIEPRVFDPSELSVGLKAAFERRVSSEDVAAFAALSGDHNPLHTNPSYASATNYGRPVVHGAFQIALASAMVGIHLPGRNVVVGSMRSRFPAPLYFPSNVAVQGEITAWLVDSQTGTVRVRVIETSQSQLTAEIHVGFGLHENRPRSAESAAPLFAAGNLPIVILTGASSSIGPDLWRALSSRYQVIGLVRSAAKAQSIAPGAGMIECDLASDDWESIVDAALANRPVYGIVHAAWPGAPQGGLLGAEPEAVWRQVEFGALTTIRLARWLARHALGAGRIVLLGSTAATVKPALNLSAYSLGKAAMEQTMRLLAPELAGKAISINAVVPSFLPQGMNAAKTRHAVLSETAKIPLGRLCTTADVASTIEFLLSEKSAFITGQLIPLTGGQL